MMRRQLLVLFCILWITACDNTDVVTAVGSGIDAVKAVTLSDEDVLSIASKSAELSDNKHHIAPPDSEYSVRLNRTMGRNVKDGGVEFNHAVYMINEANAFAMADGSIRIYSGLMDMLNDEELRFVVGHEMGHVLKKHIRKQIQLAYAASAVRKGIASQNSTAGELARSVFGSLAESLMNAKFSQLEEKEADDYGLLFLKRNNSKPQHAVSALKKLARLGKGHSFLSSHPDPDRRAERLQAQIEGRASSIEENRRSIISRIKVFMENIFTFIKDKLPWFSGAQPIMQIASQRTGESTS